MPIQFKKADFSGVAANLSQCPQDNLPEIVLSGRSNVGKSSLINSLLGRSGLARVSRTPGKTRQLIFFRIDESFYLVDLPGYGHAAVGRREKEAYSQLADAYLNSPRPIALILHLLDIRINPTAQDRQMLAWLRQAGKPWRIVLTKADKVSRSAGLLRCQAIARELDLAGTDLPIVFSGQNGTGVNVVRGLIASVLNVRRSSVLNARQ